MNLTQQRCFNHGQREAVARCLGCSRFFCRECVTEHEDRVLCAACLRQRVKAPLGEWRGFVLGANGLRWLAGLLTAWLFFYLIGRVLVALPESFHEGTLWKSSWRGGSDGSGKAVEAPARQNGK